MGFITSIPGTHHQRLTSAVTELLIVDRLVLLLPLDAMIIPNTCNTPRSPGHCCRLSPDDDCAVTHYQLKQVKIKQQFHTENIKQQRQKAFEGKNLKKKIKEQSVLCGKPIRELRDVTYPREMEG